MDVDVGGLPGASDTITEVNGRKRTADKDEGPTPPKKGQSGSAGSGGTGGSGPGTGVGLFVARPWAFMNQHKCYYTQRFLLSTDTVNWFNWKKSATEMYTQLPFYSLPLHKVHMYMTAGEYFDLRPRSRLCKIDKVGATIKYLSHRPYHPVNTTDAGIASPQNLVQMGVWKGFNQIHSYTVFDAPTVDPSIAQSSVGDPMSAAKWNEWITRLYGERLGEERRQIGAVDAFRHFTLRPTINCQLTTYNNADGNTDMRNWITGLNMAKHQTDGFNSASVGYCFNWDYKPSNGLLFHGLTATSHNPPVPDELGPKLLCTGNTVSNVSIPASSGTPTSMSIVGPAAGTSVLYPDGTVSDETYQIASIDGAAYGIWGNMHAGDRIPGLIFGAYPQIQNDGKIINGVTEWEITTIMEVDLQSGQPLPISVYNGNPQWGNAPFKNNLGNLGPHFNDSSIPFYLNQHKDFFAYGPGGKLVYTNNTSWPTFGIQDPPAPTTEIIEIKN